MHGAGGYANTATTNMLNDRCVWIYTWVSASIYIYIERERERERDRVTHTHTSRGKKLAR